MKMLSIGNSFSCDALAYFRDIAKEAGIDVEVWHMEIGGCSLERHYNNMKADMPAYNFSVNGEHRPNASLAQVIEKEEFDIVTVQQVSHSSGLYSTFHPYIDEFVAYIRSINRKQSFGFTKPGLMKRIADTAVLIITVKINSLCIMQYAAFTKKLQRK